DIRLVLSARSLPRTEVLDFLDDLACGGAVLDSVCKLPFFRCRDSVVILGEVQLQQIGAIGQLKTIGTHRVSFRAIKFGGLGAGDFEIGTVDSAAVFEA